jgi:hypothetical protein
MALDVVVACAAPTCIARTKRSPREAGFDPSFAACTAGRADDHHFIV